MQTSTSTKCYCMYKIPCHPSGKEPSGHVSKVCVCSYVKDGTWKAQDEMGTARGCSALPKVIDQGHQKIIMRTSLTAW